jgi:glycosyltransferase involved in cell wall biosynthesis
MTLPKPATSPRRWLILSHGFNMDGRAASLTVTDKIPGLLAEGIEPVVLSAVTGERDARFAHEQLLPWGPSGLRFDLRHFYAMRLGRGAAYRALMLVTSLLLAPFMVLERLLLGLRSQWSWALPAYFSGARRLRHGGIELVYSSGGAYSAHLAGAWLKRRHGCRWIAEIHDPMVLPGQAPRTRDERFIARLEGRICASADLVWWFTDGALAAARRRHPELGERGMSVLPGANPPTVRVDYARGNRFVLGHFGSLSPTRSLTPVLEALAGVLARRPASRPDWRIEVYGGGLDAPAQRVVAERGLDDVVRVVGRLERDPQTGQSGRERVQERMQRSDVLLLVHGTMADCAEYIPSKLYDYFWAARPVLALTHVNPQLDRLVAEHGGWAVPTAEPAAVEAALESAYERWLADELPSIRTPPVGVDQAVRAILDRVGDGG